MTLFVIYCNSYQIRTDAFFLSNVLPACRRLLFPLLPFPRATKEIGDVCTQAIERRVLTSKGAVEFASWLPRFQNVTRLDLHLAECSAEAVSKLFGAIKHESLEELELSEITLTPAVVESLSKSLPELTVSQKLQMKGLYGCNLYLRIPVYSLSFQTLTITGLAENAAKAITRLFDVFKHKPVDKVELSAVKLTST